MTRTLLFRLAVVVVTAVSAVACSSTKVVDTWDSGHRVSSTADLIAVYVGLPDDLQRQAFEQVFVRDLQAAGLNAIESVRIPGMRGSPDQERAIEALSAANADAIVAVFVIGAVTGGVYERSDYYATAVGSGFVGYGWWGAPAFTTVYEIRQGSGAFDVSKNVYLESNYYDFDDRAPVWRMVTVTEDVEHSDGASQVSSKIMQQMRAHDLTP